MKPKNLVRLSNIVGVVSIILLIYWVFIFICTEVFGLKVFRHNITETFLMSVLGILALMFGALIVNIMFNLTRIAQKHNADDDNTNGLITKRMGWAFLLSFPIIFGLLFAGNYLTAKKKKDLLILSAQSLISDNKGKTEKLFNYSFCKNWVAETEDILTILARTDRNSPNVSVIVRDTIYKSGVFLNFTQGRYSADDTSVLLKKDFIFESTKAEREYLENVFDHRTSELRFHSDNGNYQLFYPCVKDGKAIVLYFSDYQQYGKIGS